MNVLVNNKFRRNVYHNLRELQFRIIKIFPNFAEYRIIPFNSTKQAIKEYFCTLAPYGMGNNYRLPIPRCQNMATTCHVANDNAISSIVPYVAEEGLVGRIWQITYWFDRSLPSLVAVYIQPNLPTYLCRKMLKFTNPSGPCLPDLKY